MKEIELQQHFMHAASVALPNVRLFRRQVMNVEVKPGVRVRAALVGQADLYWITRGGRHGEIELKAARGRLSEAQLRWAAWCRGWGVPYLLLKAERGEEPANTITRWVDTLRDVTDDQA